MRYCEGKAGLLSRQKIDIAASGDNVVLEGRPDRKFVIHMLRFITAGEVDITFLSGANELTGAESYPANGGCVCPGDALGWFETEEGEDFIMNLSDAVQVSGNLVYSEVKA